MARAVKLAASKVDVNAGEELTTFARNLVISRSMPKQILADPRLAHMVDLKQFYMAMWERVTVAALVTHFLTLLFQKAGN